MKQRFLHLAKRSVSYLISNSTRNWEEDGTQVLKIYPQLMVSLVIQIISDQRKASIRIIRILSHIHLSFLILLKESPNA